MLVNGTLKQRFLFAVVAGQLGEIEDRGAVVTQKAFREFFSDITSQYVTSFLPAATIEKGRTSATRTKYVFRLRKGVYLLHPDTLNEAIEAIIQAHLDGDEPGDEPGDKPGVEEDSGDYQGD